MSPRKASPVPEASVDDGAVIRPLAVDDIEAVLGIEGKSFLAPWSRRMFEETLASPISHAFVLELEKTIVGYLVFYAVDVEGHILNVAVDPARRKEGWATRLLAHAVGLFREQDITECYLEVREHNKEARKLYDKFGFQTIGKRRRYYTETGEDALVMQLLL